MVSSLLGQESSFLAQENQIVIKKEGNISKRFSPCSTFKIAISMMGFDSGILKDPTHPVVHYEKIYEDDCDGMMAIWKQSYNPKRWIEYSCVWYSQWITKQLGMKKFKNYLSAFQYGNENARGDDGKNEGLTHCWLGSSLKISTQEQVAFLQKLVYEKLPVSRCSQEMTQKILYVGKLSYGWSLYGKTGSCAQGGWFVGWIEKGKRKIVFAHHIVDKQKMKTYAGPRARDAAKEKLQLMILSLP